MARDSLSGYLKTEANLVSLYQFGEVSDPTISDLDLLIVVKESYEGIKILQEKVAHFLKSSPKLEYIFFHMPIIINVEMASNLHLFHTVTNLIYISGKKIEFKENLYKYEESLIWNYYFYPFFWNIKNLERTSLRLLCLLSKNMLYSIRNNFRFISCVSDARIQEIVDHSITIVKDIRREALEKTYQADRIKTRINMLLEYINFQEGLALKVRRQLDVGLRGRRIEISGVSTNYYYFKIGPGVISIYPRRYSKLKKEFYKKDHEYIREIDRVLKELGIPFHDIMECFQSISILGLKSYS